ncbi:cation:proton antiporter [Chloroflexota bacterium]
MNQLDPVIGIVILLAAALVGGMIAHRLRQPIIVGYLIIGVIVGPHAFGLVSDLEFVEAAATIGVALLMFTLGLEVSITQLRQIGKVGLWGGLAQIVLTFGLGLLVGMLLFQWSLSQAAIFGLVISLSSTAVCLKILMERAELSSVHGRIMIAILIIQDISVLVMMVVVPLLGGTLRDLPVDLAMAVGKAILFIGVTIVSGLWVLPWLMGNIGGVRSRELFLLTVLVLCLGTALGTQILGLSVVFGAFLIGLVLRESRFAHQALAEITPLRDIFATLFFVSLGMLLSPSFVLDHWPSVLLMVAVIICIKLAVIFGIVRYFGFSSRIAFMTGAGLFQVGEFGFILAQGGSDSGLLSEESYSLILAGAIITMLLTPLSVSLAAWLYPKRVFTRGRRVAGARGGDIPLPAESAEAPKRVVVAGYGRVGQNIAQGLQNADIPYIVIDIDPERISAARCSKKPRIYGDASNPQVLSQVDLSKASALIVTYPDPMAVVATVKAALEINPKLHIVARVHRAREAELLKAMGKVALVSPEYQASLEFMRRILAVSGWGEADIQQTIPVMEQDQDFVEFASDEEC